MTNDQPDLETEIDRVRERYPAHNINIEYNHEGGWWALAISPTEEYDETTIVAFGGSKESLREAVIAVKPVEPKKPKGMFRRRGPTNG